MLVFWRSRNLIVPYLVMLAIFSLYTAFRFVQYMEYHNIFMTMRWLVIPLLWGIYFLRNILDFLTKVASWDSSGIPLTIRSKRGTMELINSDSYNPFTSVYGQATYYFK